MNFNQVSMSTTVTVVLFVAIFLHLVLKFGALQTPALVLPGYITHQMHKCIDKAYLYVMSVNGE